MSSLFINRRPLELITSIINNKLISINIIPCITTNLIINLQNVNTNQIPFIEDIDEDKTIKEVILHNIINHINLI